MFVCKRCQADFSMTGNLRKHLQRKKPCSAIYDPIDISQYLKVITKDIPEDIYIQKCVHCNKGFKNAITKCRHQKTCKMNPTLFALAHMCGQ